MPGRSRPRPRPHQASPDDRAWLILVHQLPPKPLYLRAKIRNRLARVGAIALKNSVYVLPDRDECLEDFQWIAEEATAGGGEAYVCRGVFLAGLSTEALILRFRRQSAERYRALKVRLTSLVGRRPPGTAPGDDAEGAAGTLRRQFEEIQATDFFSAPEGKDVATMIRSRERQRGSAKGTAAPHRTAALGHRTWVTRHNPKVDRIGSAWLIRRFIDPHARFRFIDASRETARAGELTFDMVGGDFTHKDDRCTFEALVGHVGLDDVALQAIGQIVHDIDLKDGKFGRPEVAGVQQMIAGLVTTRPDDHDRLTRGMAFFDDLYASFGRSTTTPPPRRPRR